MIAGFDSTATEASSWRRTSPRWLCCPWRGCWTWSARASVTVAQGDGSPAWRHLQSVDGSPNVGELIPPPFYCWAILMMAGLEGLLATRDWKQVTTQGFKMRWRCTSTSWDCTISGEKQIMIKDLDSASVAAAIIFWGHRCAQIFKYTDALQAELLILGGQICVVHKRLYL